MLYEWVEETEQKYGKEVTESLIKQQKDFEEKQKDNDCKVCGKTNQGSVVEIDNVGPILIHYGLRNGSGKCSNCGKY